MSDHGAAAPAGEARLLARMARLMEISQHLASTLDLARLLRRIVDAAAEVTEAEAASIMLLDAASGELRFGASTNLALEALRGLEVPLNGSVAGWVAIRSEPQIVRDAPSDPRWDARVDRLTAFQTRSILAIPLIARDRTIGVLEAVNKRAGEFNDDDVRLARWLAAQAAVALVNARLFQQSDLVAELVHELRNPLTALMATNRLLLRPELTEAQRREVVATLQRETERLSDLTTNFLDVARLEAGRLSFSVERFDPAEVVRECAGVIAPQAAAQELSVAVNVDGALPAMESDRAMLKQVLLNLLTNAVKYNRPGGSVAVTAEAQGSALTVRVSDTGPGIAPEEATRVFERFYRVRDQEGYATGTGLGLAVARRMTEALGGMMGLESQPGVGSTFWFSVPLKLRRTAPLSTEGAA
jgi:signal transduction histidine kinase